MAPVPIVLDTNVLVAGLRSRRGASFRLLSLVGRSDAFQVCLSVPLVLEYEAVLKRQSRDLGLKHDDIDTVLDYLCSVGSHHEIFYLWRPVLRDPRDDFVLELAVTAGCDTILTFNTRDFEGAERFGVRTERPREFLQRIGVLS
jgi:putative PIN family toxin of toxin-antitoxin system